MISCLLPQQDEARAALEQRLPACKASLPNVPQKKDHMAASENWGLLFGGLDLKDPDIFGSISSSPGFWKLPILL